MRYLFLIVIFLSLQCREKSSSHSFGNPSDLLLKVLEEPGVENAYPRFSADGNKILFQSNKGGKWQIYMMNKDGSEIQSMTKDTFNNNFIDWSPDNKRIAFVSDRDGNEEIYTMNTDGSDLLRITNHPDRDIHPYFSPDGKKIIFNSTRGNYGIFDIYQVDADGKNMKLLLQSGDEKTCARFSPDMRQIVYLKGVASTKNDELFVMNSDGSGDLNITRSLMHEGWPMWTFDGKKIIYAAEDSCFNLFMINANGTGQAQISFQKAPVSFARPNINKAGTEIVFNRQGESKGTIGIYIMKLTDEN